MILSLMYCNTCIVKNYSTLILTTPCESIPGVSPYSMRLFVQLGKFWSLDELKTTIKVAPAIKIYVILILYFNIQFSYRINFETQIKNLKASLVIARRRTDEKELEMYQMKQDHEEEIEKLRVEGCTALNCLL